VIIQHADGTFTRYAHNNRDSAHAGQQAEQGQQFLKWAALAVVLVHTFTLRCIQRASGAVNPIHLSKAFAVPAE